MISAFFRFLKAALGATSRVLGKVIAVTSLVVLCALAWMWYTVRMGLWAIDVPGLAKYGLLLSVIFLAGSILLFCKSKVAGAMLTAAFLLLMITNASYLFPGTAAGVKEVAQYRDKRNLQAAKASTTEVQTSFACNKTNWNTQKFFGVDGNTGATVALIWYDRTSDGRVDCYRTAGVDPYFGRPLHPVTSMVVKEISQQEVPAPIITPASAATADHRVASTPKEPEWSEPVSVPIIDD